MRDAVRFWARYLAARTVPRWTGQRIGQRQFTFQAFHARREHPAHLLGHRLVGLALRVVDRRDDSDPAASTTSSFETTSGSIAID